MIKLGIDVHGVADAYPLFFSMLSRLLVENGHEVHILTGAEHSKELERHLREDLELQWTHFFSVTSYHKEHGTQVTYIDGNPYMDNRTWNRSKSEYCRKHGIHLHIDDSDIYGKHFYTPYARFSCRFPPCMQKEEKETERVPECLHLQNQECIQYQNQPVVALDMAICTVSDSEIKVLLVKPENPAPNEGWAIPGGFLDQNSPLSLEETARGLLENLTGLQNIYMEQLKTYGNTGNNPNNHLISTAYFSLVPFERFQSILNSTEKQGIKKWAGLREMADEKSIGIKMEPHHQTMFGDLLERLVGKMAYAPIAFELLPGHFTWPELRMVYETVLDKKLDATNFKRKIKSIYNIRELETKKNNCAAGRPPKYLEYVGIKEIYT